MKMYLAVFFLCTGLTISHAQNKSSQYVTEKGDPHLLGTIERSQLQEPPFASWYDKVYERYSIDESLVNKIDEYYDDAVTIKIYLGTWCGDSKREVVRFLKIVDHSEISIDQVELIGLDNRPGNIKQGPNGEEKGLNIHRVPTFLFYKEGKEIGRVVEYPTSSLETDIAQIYAGLAPVPNYRLANYVLEQFDLKSLEEVDTLVSQSVHYLKRISKNARELNTLGYVLMGAEKHEEAVIVFKLNTLLYPEDGNTYDSLGEAYLKINNQVLAIDNYLKSLQLDSDNENAVKVLHEILIRDSTKVDTDS